MWFYIKWVFRILVIAVCGAFLNYWLPQNDIGRITDAYAKRVDFGGNWLFYSHAGVGDAEAVPSRDVFFVAAILKNGKPMEYRNEDTGWGWPPYFKFNASNLQTKASDLKSTSGDPQWVVLRRYGWRSNLYSIYPNLMSIKPVEGPDVRIIPWFNIIFLTVLFAVLGALYIRWRRFREARIDPVLEGWNESFEAAGDAIQERRGRFRRWLQGFR